MSSRDSAPLGRRFLLDGAEQKTRGGGRRFLFFERLLLTTGIALLTFYAGMRIHAQFSQAYYDWTLQRTLEGQSVLVREFIADLLRTAVGRAPARATPKPPEAPSEAKKFPKVAPGDPLGRLEIPKLGISVVVLEGTNQWTLNRGVGHIEGTALPGAPGNFAIAGHRDSFFRALKDITTDDTISITALNGTFRYRVEETRIVGPTDTRVLKSSDRPTLTLVTCYPFYYVGHAPKRFIVRAEAMD